MKNLIAACTLTLLSLTAHAGEFADIGLAELKAAIAGKRVALVDVNGDESFKEGHIPGAVLYEGREKLAKQLPSDKGALVVAYCGGPSCSAYKAAAKAAESLGYTNVKHFGAGIRGWKAAGEKTEAAR
jgi:rhodanese-related sulfurtransferase